MPKKGKDKNEKTAKKKSAGKTKAAPAKKEARPSKKKEAAQQQANQQKSVGLESTSEMHHHDLSHAGAHMSIGAQYVKDLSFESPKAPYSLVIKGEKPSIQLTVDALARKVQGDTYEVTLHIVAKAVVQQNNIIFLCDLSYCGLFTFRNVPEKAREAALLVQGANSIYPFARRLIADLTRDGGFPTLMLDPVDFGTVYAEKKRRAMAAAQAKQQAKQQAQQKPQ